MICELKLSLTASLYEPPSSLGCDAAVGCTRRSTYRKLWNEPNQSDQRGGVSLYSQFHMTPAENIFKREV